MNMYKYVCKCDYNNDDLNIVKALCSSTAQSQKNRLLQFMKSFPCYAAAAGMVYDRISGKYTNIPVLAYVADGYFWDSSDIYYLEKYNIQLNEDFVAYVLGKDSED